MRRRYTIGPRIAVVAVSVRFRSGCCRRGPRCSRRAGAGGLMIVCSERPSSIVRPAPSFAPNRTLQKRNRRRRSARRTGGTDGSVCWRSARAGSARPSRARMGDQRGERELRYAMRFSIGGVGGVDPLAAQRPHQRPHHRSLRPPELHRSPRTESANKKSATSAAARARRRRLARIGLWLSSLSSRAPRARVRMIKLVNARRRLTACLTKS